MRLMKMIKSRLIAKKDELAQAVDIQSKTQLGKHLTDSACAKYDSWEKEYAERNGRAPSRKLQMKKAVEFALKACKGD